MANFCKHCGAQLEEGARFCPSCGAQLEAAAAKSFCVSCGAELAEGAKFCKKCGTAVASAAPAQPVNPAARAAYGHQSVQTTYASGRTRHVRQERRQPTEPHAQAPAAAGRQKGYGLLTFLLLLICAGLIYLGVTRGLPNIRANMVRFGEPAIFQHGGGEEQPDTEPESAYVEPWYPEDGEESSIHPSYVFGGSAQS